MTDKASPVTGWAILELMGHRRLAGYLSVEQIAGADMLRIDVYAGPMEAAPDGFPAEAEPDATQFYGGGAVYCITPTTEATAREVARGSEPPAPVARWQLNPPAVVEEVIAGDDAHEF